MVVAAKQLPLTNDSVSTLKEEGRKEGCELLGIYFNYDVLNTYVKACTGVLSLKSNIVEFIRR